VELSDHLLVAVQPGIADRAGRSRTARTAVRRRGRYDRGGATRAVATVTAPVGVV